MPTQVLETLDAVIDVGGVFDAEKDRFDHHQRGFDQTFGRGFVTKLSSAGLVYKVTPQFKVLWLMKWLSMTEVIKAMRLTFREAGWYLLNSIDMYDLFSRHCHWKISFPSIMWRCDTVYIYEL